MALISNIFSIAYHLSHKLQSLQPLIRSRYNPLQAYNILLIVSVYFSSANGFHDFLHQKARIKVYNINVPSQFDNTYLWIESRIIKNSNRINFNQS